MNVIKKQFELPQYRSCRMIEKLKIDLIDVLDSCNPMNINKMDLLKELSRVIRDCTDLSSSNTTIKHGLFNPITLEHVNIDNQNNYSLTARGVLSPEQLDGTTIRSSTMSQVSASTNRSAWHSI